MKRVYVRLLFACAMLLTAITISAPAIPQCPPGYVWTCQSGHCFCSKGIL